MGVTQNIIEVKREIYNLTQNVSQTTTSLENTITSSVESLEESKADIDLSNCTVPYIIETYTDYSDESYPSWYRIWSDGWCEQGAYISNSAKYKTVTFLIEFTDTPFVTAIDGFIKSDTDTAGYDYGIAISTVTTSTFRATVGAHGFIYHACGYVEV